MNVIRAECGLQALGNYIKLNQIFELRNLNVWDYGLVINFGAIKRTNLFLYFILGSFKTSESKSSSLFIPIILRNATMKSISRRNFPQNHMTVTSTVTQNASAEGVQTKEPGQQERTNKFDQQEKEPQCDSVQGNIAIIKSVFKTSAALHLLQDIQESYYCSYDQMNSGNCKGIGFFFCGKYKGSDDGYLTYFVNVNIATFQCSRF